MELTPKTLNKTKSSAKWFSNLFARLVVLQTLTMLINSLVMIADSLVVARHMAESDLTAFGLVSPVGTASFAISLIMGSGIGIISIRALAESGAKKARNIFFTCLLTALLFGVLLSTALLVFAEPLALLLCGRNVSEEVLAGAGTHIRWFAFSLPAMIASSAFTATFHMDREDKLLVFAVLAGTASDVILDYVFALVCKNGLLGMALATLISVYVQAGVLAVHIFRKNVIFQVRGVKPDFSEKLRFIRRGVPGGIRNILISVLVIFANKIILDTAGENGVSAFTALATVAAVIRVTSDAVQNTVVSLTTLFDGERDEKMIRKVFSYGTRFALIVAAVLGILGFLFARPIMSLFFSPGQVLDYATNGLRYVAIGLIPLAAGSALYGAYQAFGDFKRVYAIAFVFDFLMQLICMLLQVKFMGINGVWLSYVTGKAIPVLGYLIFYALKDRKRLTGGRLLKLDTERYNNIRSFEFEARSPGECAEISERIRQCMTENGASARESYAFSLAVEEMGNYTFTYGAFNADRYFSAFLCIDGESRVLRIRNNAKALNPLRCLSGEDAVDEFSLIGIKLVRKMISSIDYIYTVGINNIILTFERDTSDKD